MAGSSSGQVNRCERELNGSHVGNAAVAASLHLPFIEILARQRLGDRRIG
jgi:hypothetical protein